MCECPLYPLHPALALHSNGAYPAFFKIADGPTGRTSSGSQKHLSPYAHLSFTRCPQSGYLARSGWLHPWPFRAAATEPTPKLRSSQKDKDAVSVETMNRRSRHVIFAHKSCGVVGRQTQTHRHTGREFSHTHSVPSSTSCWTLSGLSTLNGLSLASIWAWPCNHAGRNVTGKTVNPHSDTSALLHFCTSAHITYHDSALAFCLPAHMASSCAVGKCGKCAPRRRDLLLDIGKPAAIAPL
ncbi:hypothetical protein BKA56DRAFT_598629 [Ilyonectria sp. MPI-CAGE-AT-0026]|nr:hypothetical protein BKA56DRAFT_598629 [Ilyonectria sp. MPI-CAGE-AT-0026]